MVKLLDVFYKGQCTGDEIAIPGRPAAGGDSAAHNRTEPDICEPRDTFHYPYARVTQTLPSHESSVGALAVGFRAENSCTSSGVQGVVISGGGKMELRAWCLEDQLGIETDVGRGKAAAMDATCTPPVGLLRFAASLAQFFFYPAEIYVHNIVLIVAVHFAVAGGAFAHPVRV